MQFLDYHTLLGIEITILLYSIIKKKPVSMQKKRWGKNGVRNIFLSVLWNKLPRIIYETQLFNYSLFRGHSSIIYLRKCRLIFNVASPESMILSACLTFKSSFQLVLFLVNTWNLEILSTLKIMLLSSF